MCEANVVEIAKFFTLFCEYLEWEYLTFGLMSGLQILAEYIVHYIPAKWLLGCKIKISHPVKCENPQANKTHI